MEDIEFWVRKQCIVMKGQQGHTEPALPQQPTTAEGEPHRE